MSRKIIISIALFVLVLVGGFSKSVWTAQKLTVQDYMEIHQLYAHYNYAIDSRADDGWMWAKLFTVDGVFETPSGPVKGHAQLREMAKPQNDGSNLAPVHFATNIIIHPTQEGAKGSSYLILVGDTQSGKQVVTGKGFYDDLLVKTSKGWRFQKRSYMREAFPVE